MSVALGRFSFTLARASALEIRNGHLTRAKVSRR